MSHSRLSDPEYRNWITVGRAIQITRNGLESIIQNAVDNYHTSLLACATLPSNIHAWKSHLATAHRSTDKRKICWSNSDNSQWLTAGASWEIAKIFMAPLGHRKLDVVNAKTTDISGLLNVLEWSPRGTNGIFNAGVSLSKLADVRGARNLWAHAPLLHTTDVDKAKAFAFFTSLLQDPELQHDKDVQYAINELNNLLKTGLAVIEENELEILVQLQRQLAQDMDSLKSDISCWKDEVDTTLEQNELQNVLKTVQKRISDLEHQIVGPKKPKKPKNTSRLLGKLESVVRFNPVCDRMKEEFVGREWLFSIINSWLEEDFGPRESRVFLIGGSPGTGKSSFAQELVRRHENLNTLAGYHYCQKDNPRTCKLESLVHNLSNMLKRSLSGYAALVAGLNSTADELRDQPDELFDLLITTPLQQLEENTKHFLVIDGMDEGDDEIASCFARLSATLPSWLLVILTARHNAPALSNHFPGSDVASLDHFTPSHYRLFPVSHRNIDKDIREFVSMKYRTLLSKYKYIIPSFFENEQEGKEKIVKASKNCFLYAKLVMEHIFDGHDKIGLPASLSEVYCLDFKRRFPDVEFFREKVAPVLEIVLAIQCSSTYVYYYRFDPNYFRKDNFEQGDECVTGVVNRGLLPGTTMRDLSKVLNLLFGYLGKCHFIHSSVRDWLQEKKPDFSCDVRNGHSIMAAYNLKILKDKNPSPEDFVGKDWERFDALLGLKVFFWRYLFYSSYSPQSEISNVNVLISELGIEAIDLLQVALTPCFGDVPIACSECMAMEVLDETDVLDKMTIREKVEVAFERANLRVPRVMAKVITSAYWIFSTDVIRKMFLIQNDQNVLERYLQIIPKKLMPQLFFSITCVEFLYFLHDKVQFCLGKGFPPDVCVPEFFKNTEGFDSSICWNEDVQEYFRKLKTDEKSVITLESLKEESPYPKEAKVSEFTLEIIQKPLSEIERLVRDGEICVTLKYAWHFALTKLADSRKAQGWIEFFLEHGVNPNNRGGLGTTGLMLACKKHDDGLVSLLLKHGAEVNQQDFYGCAALHYAFKSIDANSHTRWLDRTKSIVQTLTQHKADIYLKDSSGLSAIDMAELMGHGSWLDTDEELVYCS